MKLYDVLWTEKEMMKLRRKRVKITTAISWHSGGLLPVD